MINITDDRARRLWQQEMNRQMEVLEKPYIRKLTSLLKRQFREASKYVSQGMLRDINFAVDKTRKENLDLLKIHYRKVFTVFGNKAYGILEKTKFISVPEMKSPMDEYWSEINRWIETEAATKIRGIQDATKRTIASIIQSGMREQLSHRDIAKKIEQTSTSINPYRARTISLTETHTGAVKAVDSAVKSTRIEMEKEWVSSKDMRTRTRDKGSPFEHYKTFPAGADRERVPMDSKFIGTGQPMTLPGVGGSGGNVIRCRCVVLYFTVNQVVQQTKPYEPEEQVNLEIIGDVSDAHVQDIKKMLDQIPKEVTKVLSDNDVQVRTARMISDADPVLKGHHPRGWLDGMTWDHADGFYNPVRKIATVTENRLNDIDEIIKVTKERKREVLYHELGHGIDWTIGISTNSKFIEAYEKDVKKVISNGLSNHYSYFLQSGIAGRQETAAQLMLGLIYEKKRIPSKLITEFRHSFKKSYSIAKELVKQGKV